MTESTTTKSAPRSKRRTYFKFSLQSLLLLTLVCALGFGWWSDHRRLRREIESGNTPSPHWDTNQVLGPPNTMAYGDISTAWASSTPDGRDEWLLLEFGRRVVPTSIRVHETYNPGALTKVTAFKSNGDEVVLWSGTDPTPRTSKRAVSVIPVSASFKTKTVKIYLASKSVPGWNEIDAVGLTYGKDKTMWALHAYASSSYGKNNDLPLSLRNLLP